MRLIVGFPEILTICRNTSPFSRDVLRLSVWNGDQSFVGTAGDWWGSAGGPALGRAVCTRGTVPTPYWGPLPPTIPSSHWLCFSLLLHHLHLVLLCTAPTNTQTLHKPFKFKYANTFSTLKSFIRS